MTDLGYFRVGDTVTVRGAANPQLVVTGFQPLYVGRLSGCERPPGVYIDPSHVAVRTSEGVQRDGYYFHTALVHPNREVAAARSPRFAEPIMVSDLPDTAFWEGDTVQMTDSARKYYVAAIDYSVFVTGAGTPQAQLMPYVVNERCWPVRIYKSDEEEHAAADGAFVPPRELTLIERGNAWRESHDMPLIFSSLQEEIAFYLMMGWFEPTNEPVHTEHDAYHLTANGKIDGFYATGNHIITRNTYGVCLRDAREELRDEFRRLCLAADLSTPTFLLP